MIFKKNKSPGGATLIHGKHSKGIVDHQGGILLETDGMPDHVQGQEQHHRIKTFQEEYVDLLVRQGIEFETRYIWD